ncbi:hypothetical protein [Paenibacillus sp. FSL L8-0506]
MKKLKLPKHFCQQMSGGELLTMNIHLILESGISQIGRTNVSGELKVI